MFCCVWFYLEEKWPEVLLCNRVFLDVPCLAAVPRCNHKRAVN